MNTVRPRLSDRSAISWSKAPAPMGSRPEVGSSRNSSSGSSARARARLARLIIPPDSSDGCKAPANLGRPARAILSSASSSIIARGMSVCSRIGAATFCLTVRFENRAPRWNSTPQRRSMALHWALEADRRSRPKILTLPASGRFRPMMVLSSTDLPVPDPPTTPRTSPRRTVRSRSLCTTWSPNCDSRPLTSMGGASSSIRRSSPLSPCSPLIS